MKKPSQYKDLTLREKFINQMRFYKPGVTKEITTHEREMIQITVKEIIFNERTLITTSERVFEYESTNIAQWAQWVEKKINNNQLPLDFSPK